MQGKLDGCEYWIKQYVEPSAFGIGKGRISKLTVKRDGCVIMSYDRDWDLEPKTDEGCEILARILKLFN